MVSSVYRKKRDRPVVRIALGVIIVSLLVIPVASFFYHLNGDSYDFTDSELLIVPTDSMDGGPTEYEISTIPKNSMIMTQSLSDGDKEKLKVGDVITFYQDDIYKVHRIILIYKDQVITKGDANTVTDPPITKEDIKCKVVGVSIAAGFVVSFVKSIVGNPWALGVIAVFILLVMLWEIRTIILVVKDGKEPATIKST